MKLLIFCTGKIDENEEALAELTEFMGLDYEFVYIDELGWKGIKNGDVLAAAVSGRSLEDIYERGLIEKFKLYLTQEIPYVFVYGISPRIIGDKALNCLTNGIVKSVKHNEFAKCRYEINKENKDICGEFAGLSFGPINKELDFRFQINGNIARRNAVISINGAPYFLRIESGKCNMFILGNSRIVNIHNKIDGGFVVKEYFSQIIPALMFLKYVYRQFCWHNDTKQACLIIDDPLLKENYGFLNYRKLLEYMDRNNFFTEIAFIPWNFRRTDRKIANLITERHDKFSICVHGYGHTDSEFGSEDINDLNSKVKSATRNMELHKNITGLEFDKVMVFPQGVFSTKSLEVLKANNYLAAVNSEFAANNMVEGLRMWDFLEPAVMEYRGFPLFIRRYPEEIVDFAFDLFIGKPALIVVHHDIFREGYQKIINFINAINSLNSRLRWRSLGEIIKNSYIQKLGNGEENIIKIYSTRAVIENKWNDAKKFVILKKEDQKAAIEDIEINGEKIDYRCDKELLILSGVIETGGSLRLELNYRDILPFEDDKGGRRKNIRINVRRYMSEFRDNYVSRSKVLSWVAGRMKEIIT